MYMYCVVVTGVRMHRSVLFSTERPPDSDQARHHTDHSQRQLPTQSRTSVLRTDAPRSHLHLVRRRPGNSHVQVQVRRHGGRRVWLSVNENADELLTAGCTVQTGLSGSAHTMTDL